MDRKSTQACKLNFGRGMKQLNRMARGWFMPESLCPVGKHNLFHVDDSSLA